VESGGGPQECGSPHRPPAAHQRRQVLARHSPHRQRLLRQVNQTLGRPERQVPGHTARPRAGSVPAEFLVGQPLAGVGQCRLHAQGVEFAEAQVVQ